MCLLGHTVQQYAREMVTQYGQLLKGTDHIPKPTFAPKWPNSSFQWSLDWCWLPIHLLQIDQLSLFYQLEHSVLIWTIFLVNHKNSLSVEWHFFWVVLHQWAIVHCTSQSRYCITVANIYSLGLCQMLQRMCAFWKRVMFVIYYNKYWV